MAIGRVLTDRSVSMRRLMREHVSQRLVGALAKWHGKNDSLAKQEVKKAHEKYSVEKILEKGIACSTNIVVATHIAKATHPDLKAKVVSNLNIRFGDLPARREIGSHLLPQGKSLADTTGDGAYNSAAYELYLLLDLEFEGKSLCDWLLEEDRDAVNAFADDAENDVEANLLASNYVALLSEKVSRPTADTKTKQVFWLIADDPTDDAGYHLLQPLFPSSFVHAVHREINDARFGEGNKAARQARRDNFPHDQTYRDYRNLVIRKLGGTKPQNISHLNSERAGVNYLLASLPPQWDQDRPRQFLFIDSALSRFRRFEGVDELVDGLVALLKGNPTATMETRLEREYIERALGQSLVAFGLSTRELFSPGWTRDVNCLLPLSEQLWLDPERVELPLRSDCHEDDLAFNAAFEWNGWPAEVAHRFGNWINAILFQHGIPVGDAEHAQWAKQAIIDAEWPARMYGHVLTESERQAQGVAHD